MTSLVHQKAVNVTFFIAVASALVMPDILFELLVELLHLMLELTHFLFEIFESALDHLVEHVFHTEPRETQIIVFYILIAIGLIASYFLSISTVRLVQAVKNYLEETFLSCKNSMLAYWAASAANKFQVIAWFHVALTLVVLFGF